MTMDTNCNYRERRDEILVAYLYDDISAADRAAFEMHLPACSVCRRELEELGVVRLQLEQWAPPEPLNRALSGQGFSSGPKVVRPGAWWTRLGHIPAWAQVAAAMLFLGVSAAIANLDISYNSSGLSVRTGWSVFPGAAAPVPARQTIAVKGPDDNPSPWQADLAALEQELRTEMRAVSMRPEARAAASPSNQDAILSRVRALIEESEQRQQRELALRIAEVDSIVRAQRVADLRNIERNLTAIQSNTGVGMRQLYRMTNDLAVKVAQPR